MFAPFLFFDDALLDRTKPYSPPAARAATRRARGAGGPREARPRWPATRPGQPLPSGACGPGAAWQRLAGT
eukprot:4455010-Pyramimonas_sp.AAC.1